MQQTKKSIKKFKNIFFLFFFKYFLVALLPLFFKRLIRYILKIILGKKNLNEFGNFLQNKFKTKMYFSLGKKLKNI